jgi:ABC-type lipoprotein export system ATPase subunit
MLPDIQAATGGTRMAATETTIDLRDGATPPPALELRGIHHAYERAGSRIEVLRGIDLQVEPGEVIAVVGRSGSGKSTLLHVAGGLVTPDRGEVVVGGVAVAAGSAAERARQRRRGVGFVFQFFHLLPHLSVLDNVALPLVLDGVALRRARVRAAGVLESVELGDRASHLPSELSGGELQRAAVARALVADPAVVLADEPTGNLDSTTAATVLDLLVGRVRAAGRTLVLVTHDHGAAASADRVVEIVDGELS